LSGTARFYRVQRWIWVPLQEQQALISLLCGIGVLILGSLGFAGFPALKAYADIQANDHTIIVFTTLLLGCNFLLLLRQSRQSYLSLAKALIPTTTCLGALSLISFVVTTIMAPHPSATDAVVPQMRALFVAQGGLAAVLAMAALFKNDNELVLELARPVQEVRRIRDGFLLGTLATDRETARRVRTALVYNLDKLLEWIKKNGPIAQMVSPEKLSQAKAAARDLVFEIPSLSLDRFQGPNMQIERGYMQRLDLISELLDE
jgi:hypothetical protein